MAQYRHFINLFVGSNNCWSVFANEYLIIENEKKKWVTELNFYMGKLENIDYKTDCRFCEIKDKRKQIKYLGTCKTKFPIKYPLLLKNGTWIEESEYYR